MKVSFTAFLQIRFHENKIFLCRDDLLFLNTDVPENN